MANGEHAKPFLTFHVGQAGVQIGHAIWELLCMEHNILPDGSARPECPGHGYYDAVFLKGSSGHFTPRSVFVDTDPSCINEIRKGPYRELFSSHQLLSDTVDAGFNYMTGRHRYRNRLVPDTLERFRWLVEKSDVTPAIFAIHGVSGGTGGGLAVACLEELHGEFGSSLQVLDLSVTSGHSGLQNSCELVNQVLYQYESKDFTSVVFSVTNSALYNMCRSGLNLSDATYTHLNRMLAMCFSNLTSMERFPGTLPCSLSSICSNAVPFKHLKHLLLACAPFRAADVIDNERLNAIGVTSAVLEQESQLADVDLRRGRHMAGVLLYRGATKPSDIEQALASLRAKGRAEFVDWAPPSFRAGLIELPPLAVPLSGIGSPALSVTLVSNHTTLSALLRGQTESIRKLSGGGFFMHYYDGATDGGGLSAGHNIGVAGLLKEACDHMEEMAQVYEREAPQPPPPAPRPPQPPPSQRLVAPPPPPPPPPQQLSSPKKIDQMEPVSSAPLTPPPPRPTTPPPPLTPVPLLPLVEAGGAAAAPAAPAEPLKSVTATEEDDTAKPVVPEPPAAKPDPTNPSQQSGCCNGNQQQQGEWSQSQQSGCSKKSDQKLGSGGSGGGCCRKRGSTTRAAADAAGRGAARSQLQNSAIWYSHSADGSSLQSGNCSDLAEFWSAFGALPAAGRGAADSADFSDIIRDCLMAAAADAATTVSVPAIDGTISSVRRMIQKYNGMFDDATGTASDSE